MLTLTDEQVDWLDERIPDHPRDPRGGRPPVDKRQAIRGIFWILDHGAKWKDLPRRFGSKSAVHRWFKKWVEDGVFEDLMRDAGQCVEERDGYKLYECFIDGTFAKAKGGGDGIGCTKAGKGVKIMVLVDARGMPVAVDTALLSQAVVLSSACSSQAAHSRLPADRAMWCPARYFLFAVSLTTTNLSHLANFLTQSRSFSP